MDLMQDREQDADTDRKRAPWWSASGSAVPGEPRANGTKVARTVVDEACLVSGAYVSSSGSE